MKIELLVAIFLVIAVGALTTPTVPYLRDFDPWYHYRLAEYTFEQGTRPSFDPLSNMGEKIIYPPLLHYLLAIPAHLPGLNVMLVAQIYPLAAALFALIFVFLFTREVFDERTAILAVMLLAVLPIFKGTTDFGSSDHDPLDYLFLSSAFFFFVKAMKQPSSSVPSKKFIEHKEKLLYYALAGISMGLFALTWVGFPLLVVILSAFMLIISLSNPQLKLLEKDITIGFLAISLVFAVIASLWYGFDMMPFLGIMLFSALFSCVALRLENNRNAFAILLAIVLLCSLPFLILFKSSIVDAGLTYMGLREKGVYLEYVAELQTPTLTNISQHYGLQTLPFLAGLILFATSIKKFNRATLFFLVSFALFAFLASTAIRFLQYAGIFVSIFSAYLINRLSDIASSSVKKDVFIPVMLLSAVLFFPPQIVHYSVSADWHTSMQWLKNNSNPDSAVMSWWDYSQWVNGIAERKTVVNNQPPGRFDDQMIFFGTNNWDRAKDILKKYNVSYVVVSRGSITKIYLAEKFLNEKIEFDTAIPLRTGNIYSARFGTGFRTYYDPTLNVAWDEYPDGRKVYYKEFGLFNGEAYKNQYFTSAPARVEFTDDYLFMFDNLFIRIPPQTKNRVFFNLMYTNSTIPYLELVKDEGEVRIYKVV